MKNWMLMLTLAMWGLCASAQPVTVQVGRQADGHFEVVYRLAEPAERLVFVRNISTFRHQRWSPQQARFVLDNGYETLLADQPTRWFRLTLPDTTETLVKDYELVRRFTDGSAALYTGHLTAVPMSGALEAERVDQAFDRYPNRFVLVPLPEEQVVAEGRRSQALLEIEDNAAWGTYVYFGSIDPVQGDRVLAVLDPGLPDWAVQRMETLIPRLFDHYAQALGLTLEQRPTVLFSYTPQATGGLQSGGGALPGLLQLNLTGDGWRTAQASASEGLDHLLAHEAAHLWNNHRVVNTDSVEAAWLHEGGADALAYRALLDLGQITPARYHELIEHQLNTCLAGLGERSLAQAGSEGDFGLHYDCGSALWALLGTADGDMMGLLARLHALADGDDDRYGWALFKSLLAATWPDSTVPDTGVYKAVESLAQSAVMDAVDAFTDLAAMAGFKLVEDPDPADGQYQAQQGARAMAHLMGQDCGGRFSFQTEPGGFRLSPPEACTTFSGPGMVEKINGLAAVARGAGVYDAVVSACRSGSPLALALADGSTLEVPCDLALEPRAPYRRLMPQR